MDKYRAPMIYIMTKDSLYQTKWKHHKYNYPYTGFKINCEWLGTVKHRNHE